MKMNLKKLMPLQKHSATSLKLSIICLKKIKLIVLCYVI